MSLTVLKRKAQTKYGKLSSRGEKGFSINNPRRVDSHSNQTQTQTLMRGTAPRGHGSCCGHYPVVINKSQYVNYDFHERQYTGPKSNQGISVKNHAGSIATRFKWMNGTYPNSVVKDVNPDTYEIYLKKKAGKCGNQNFGVDNMTVEQASCEGSSKTKDTANIVKNVNTLTQSEYMKTKLLTKNCLPTPASKEHVPKPVSGPCNTCN